MFAGLLFGCLLIGFMWLFGYCVSFPLLNLCLFCLICDFMNCVVS